MFIVNCSNSEYRQLSNGNIISPNNDEYVYFAKEGKYYIVGEQTFISHIRGQPKKLQHMGVSVNAGVYSCNNDPCLKILYRIRYDSEWYELYIKKELSKNNYTFEGCDAFGFIDDESKPDIKYFESNVTIKDEVEVKSFINDIKNNESSNLIKDQIYVLFSDYKYIGSLYGIYNDIPYLIFPGSICKDNLEKYYLAADNKVYEFNSKWLEKFMIIEE
jgi:hypothetical protein